MSELPDSISPCANVRRSCNALMEDPSDEQEGGIRSVIIDTTAMDTLADKISQSILDKFQKEESDSTTNGTSTSTSTRTASSSICLSGNDNNNLDGCIDNLNFASWDEENWHYTASDFHRPQMSKENEQKHKFERVALYIMVMDCINFCFWPVTDSKECSKQGCRQGTAQGSSQKKNLLEYEHLASALKALAAKDDGLTTTCESRGTNYDTHDEVNMNETICAEDSYLLAPQNLVKMTEESFLNVILPLLPLLPIVSDDDESQSKKVYMIPNAKERVRLIIEMSQALLTFHDGSATSFIAKASRSADKLVHLILQNFPGFRDATVDPWKGRWLAFYKRAQILVADLWAALGIICENQSKDYDGDSTCSSLRRTSCVGKFGIDLCNFVDMNKITTFADYRVPQLLRNLGVLRYSTALAGQVDRGEEMDVFSMDELYIRASTVQAVDRLVDKVSDRIVGKLDISMNINSVKMDWYLWNIGEKLDRECKLEKHHRVRTIFY